MRITITTSDPGQLETYHLDVPDDLDEDLISDIVEDLHEQITVSLEVIRNHFSLSA